MKMNRRKGQNLVDLAVILGVAGLIFVTMQTYVKRGVQGKVKDATDLILSSTQADAEGSTYQQANTETDSNMNKSTFVGGSSTLVGDERTVYKYDIPAH